MSYLALDLGTKTVGMAISHSGIIASPLETYRFPEGHYELAVSYVKKTIETNQIKVLIIGLPKHMNNDEGERAKHSQWFLEQFNNIEVILWDERLTTKSAIIAMRDMKLSDKDKKAYKDTMAAILILQNYLNYKGV
jgi:putative holliday junction resolvase